MDGIGQDVRSFFCYDRRSQDACRRLGGDVNIPLDQLTCLKVLLNYLKKVLPANK